MNYKQLMWEHHHYRFGLAGEGQADIIEISLGTRPGRVITVGCGPDGEKINNLARQTQSLIAADRSLDVLKAAAKDCVEPNVRFVLSDARKLCFADESFHDIVAFGLFSEVPQGETGDVMAEFYRVTKPTGRLMLTNSVKHPINLYRECGIKAGFELVQECEGHCCAATGDIPRRYLLEFLKK